MAALQDILDHATRHHGLVTRAELEAAGVTRGVRRGLVGRGILTPVGRRTFRVAGAPRTPQQTVLAASLETGGVAAGRTAARLHRIGTVRAPQRPEVLIARSQHVDQSPLALVHTTTWLPSDDIVLVDRIPTLSVARTLFSLAALVPKVSVAAVTGAFEGALGTEKVGEQRLWWQLERTRRRGRNGVTVFEAILTARSSGEITESWLERETLRVLRNAGLPMPVCQERIAADGAFVARVDFSYSPQMVIIEVSGHRWHRSRDQLNADLRRRRALTLRGYQVLEYSYDDVVQHPGRLVAEVAEALAGRLAA